MAGLEVRMRKLNRGFPFTYQFPDEAYGRVYRNEAMTGQLSYVFAALAIFISCLGLLGLAIFTAEQRSKEIAIRKVLGAGLGQLSANMLFTGVLPAGVDYLFVIACSLLKDAQVDR